MDVRCNNSKDEALIHSKVGTMKKEENKKKKEKEKKQNKTKKNKKKQNKIN